MISIKKIAKKDLYTLSSSDSVGSAVELKEKRGVDYLLVEEEGEIKGVVTSHELVGYPSSRLLIDCKIKPIATIAEETWLNEALKVSEEKEVNFLVILNREGSPIGVINKEIIISFLYQEVKKSNKEKKKQITERKRAEEALRESEQNFSDLVKNSPDGILIADEKGAHLFANQRAAEITGYSVDELQNITIKEMTLPEELDMYSERYRKRIMGEPVPRQYERLIVRKDGTTVLTELTTTTTVWKGKVCDMATIRDITERIQAEDELKESEERFRTMFELSPYSTVYTDLEGKILVYNQQFVEIHALKKVMRRRLAETYRSSSLRKNGHCYFPLLRKRSKRENFRDQLSIQC